MGLFSGRCVQRPPPNPTVSHPKELSARSIELRFQRQIFGSVAPVFFCSPATIAIESDQQILVDDSRKREMEITMLEATISIENDLNIPMTADNVMKTQ